MYVGLYVNVRYFCLILTKIGMGLHIIMKIPSANFTKILPVVVALFHVDGRTDRRDTTRLSIC